jgi:uncharacterized membrane protein
MILVRILIMSKSGFEDEVLIKLIVGVVKHVTYQPINIKPRLGSSSLTFLVVAGILTCKDFYFYFVRR